MKLHDTLTNKKCIGREVTAQPDINREWITYSASNEGEENYYRDYYDKETGIICYMYGETCKIEGFDNGKETVFLSNDNIILEIFEIPYEQYVADFGIMWKFKICRLG